MGHFRPSERHILLQKLLILTTPLTHTEFTLTIADYNLRLSSLQTLLPGAYDTNSKYSLNFSIVSKHLLYNGGASKQDATFCNFTAF